MAGLVLMLMVAVMAVVLLYRLVRQKPIKKLLFSYSIVLGSYLMIVSCTCGPNPKDVAVMKPMAEKISDYIVKHGIPKSLKDIPELPYVLEGCERSEEYLKSDNKGGVENSLKQHAILHNVREKCYFKNIELMYWLQEDLEEKNHISISLKMISFNETVYDTGLALKEKNQFIKLETDVGSYKSTGICNPMRQ